MAHPLKNQLKNQHINKTSKGLTRREFLWLTSICSASACSGTALLTGCSVNPVTGKQQLMLMSEAQEISLDKERSPHQFSADYGITQDEALNQYIDNIGRSLSNNSHRVQMPFSFQAVNANYINAYAFPGGSIAVSRGILVELEDESELAGLLGHEIGHVAARHTAQRMTKGSLFSLALSTAGAILDQSGGGAYSPIAKQAASLGGTALLAHYSRDNERQADALGMSYMVKSEQNPNGMVKLMDLLQSINKKSPSALEQMFSTHPMSQERFSAALARANTQFSHAKSLPRNRERFQDSTAALRKIKPTIQKLNKAERALATKQVTKAKTLIGSSLKATPNDYVANLLMGKVLLIEEKPQEASPFLKKAQSLYPKEAQAHHYLGLTQLELNQPENALEAFNHFAKLLPGNPNTVFLQGYSYEKMAHTTQAAEKYQTYLRLAPQGEQANYAVEKLNRWNAL